MTRVYSRRQIMGDFLTVKPYVSEGLKFHLDMSDYAPETNTVREKVKGWDFKLNNCEWKGNHILFAPDKNQYVTKPPHWINCPEHTMGDWGLQAKKAGENNWTVEVVLRRNHLHPLDLNTGWHNNATEFIVQNGLYYTPGYVTNIQDNWVTYSIECNQPWNRTKVGLLPSIKDTVGQLFTHSLNADHSIYNGTDYGMGDYVSITRRNGLGTLMGCRSDGWYSFRGEIYQVRIYHRTLSEDEMRYNQEQDRKRYGIIF